MTRQNFMAVFNKPSTGSGAPVPFLVAANDALQQTKDAASYQCDGVADDVQIQEAIDAAGAIGAKVILSEGTFVTAAAILPDNKTSLIGAGRDVTIIQPADLIHGINCISKSDITLQGFTMDGVTPTTVGTHCIRIFGSTDVTVRDVKIIDWIVGHAFHPKGICSRIRFENCYANNTSGFGYGSFTLEDCSDSWVTNCFAGTSNIHGIQTKDTCDNVIISGCQVENAGNTGTTPSGHGIRVESVLSTRILISDCSVLNSRQSNVSISGGLFVTISNCVLSGTVAAAGGDGITVRDSAKHITITGNIIRTAAVDGIYVRAVTTQNVVITGNYINNNGNDGIQLEAPTDINVTGNIVTDNGDNGIELFGAFTRIIINSNSFNDNTGDGLETSGTTGDDYVITGNNCFNNTGTNFDDGQSVGVNKVVADNLTT